MPLLFPSDGGVPRRGGVVCFRNQFCFRVHGLGRLQGILPKSVGAGRAFYYSGIQKQNLTNERYASQK